MSRRLQWPLDRHHAGFILSWTLNFFQFLGGVMVQVQHSWAGEQSTLVGWVSSSRWGGGAVGGWRIMEPGNTGRLALASWKIQVKRLMHVTCELTLAGRAISHPNFLGRPFDCWHGQRGRDLSDSVGGLTAMGVWWSHRLFMHASKVKPHGYSWSTLW
jgi:hypothetical protein